MNAPPRRAGSDAGRTDRSPRALLRALIERLPSAPPSFALAQLLNQLLLPRLDAQTRHELAGRTVEIHVSDLGLRCRLALDTDGDDGFAPVPGPAPAAVRVVAPAASFWRLASGRDDPDTLFFERALVMEGDTDYALLLKNSLDAVGPLHLTDLRPPTPAQALAAARAAVRLASAQLRAARAA